MKRKQIVERIAEAREVPLHTAADWLDSFLHDLLQHLKGARFPGIRNRAPRTAKGPPVEAQVNANEGH